VVTLVVRLALLDSNASNGNLGRLSTALGGQPWGLTVPVFSLPLVPGACELLEDIIDQRGVKELVKKFEDKAILVLNTLPQDPSVAGSCLVVPFGTWDELLEALCLELIEGIAFALEDAQVSPKLLPLPVTLWEPEVTEEDAHPNRERILGTNSEMPVFHLRLLELDIIDTSEPSESVAAA
jgi:hypothetical protein